MDHLPTGERMAAMSDALAKKLGGFFRVSSAVSDALMSLCEEPVTFAPGENLVEQGGRYRSIYLIENGWVLRSRSLPDGGRQIVNVAVPGDFAALNAMLFSASDFTLSARTEVSAFRMTAERARQALSSIPGLAAALFWANSHEESILAERIVSLGRRSARTRTAHVLCEFIARLEIIDQVSFPELAIPISQDDFADILGISLVHMNKVLRALDREGVVSFRLGVLLVRDRRRLERIAGFEDGYLHFTRRTDLID